MLVAKMYSACWESSLIQLAIKRPPLVSIIVHSNNMTKQAHSSMLIKWEDDVWETSEALHCKYVEFAFIIGTKSTGLAAIQPASSVDHERGVHSQVFLFVHILSLKDQIRCLLLCPFNSLIQLAIERETFCDSRADVCKFKDDFKLLVKIFWRQVDWWHLAPLLVLSSGWRWVQSPCRQS